MGFGCALQFEECVFFLLELNGAYVENAIDAVGLLHAKQEDCQTSTRAYILGEDVEETMLVREARGTNVRGNALSASSVNGVDKVARVNAGGC